MAVDTTPKKAPVLFFSHGAGPFAILGAPFQDPLVDLCKETRWVLDGAKGIIVVTAHWEEDQPHISSSATPELYFDYFAEEAKKLPKAAWEIEYPCKGDPVLAKLIKEQLDAVGFESVLDEERGWDHGVWVPMILYRPQGDIPAVQLSIPGQGPDRFERALKLGRALHSLRDQGYLILGSGHSFHNYEALIPAIMGVPGSDMVQDNRPFEDALEEVATKLTGVEREKAILNWREFPDSEYVHPIGKDEHFIPLIVSIGAAGRDAGKKLGEWEMFGSHNSSYVW